MHNKAPGMPWMAIKASSKQGDNVTWLLHLARLLLAGPTRGAVLWHQFQEEWRRLDPLHVIRPGSPPTPVRYHSLIAAHVLISLSVCIAFLPTARNRIGWGLLLAELLKFVRLYILCSAQDKRSLVCSNCFLKCVCMQLPREENYILLLWIDYSKYQKQFGLWLCSQASVLFGHTTC